MSLTLGLSVRVLAVENENNQQGNEQLACRFALQQNENNQQEQQNATDKFDIFNDTRFS